MSNKFYITTPIYYANGVPHIWHAYTSFICDVLSRLKRSLWYEVKFATGTDENGQKMKQSAEKVGMEVMAFLDDVAWKHKEMRDALSISYTDFIRTTEPRHHAFVQTMLQKTHEAWDIYQGEYEWLYCVGCEWFKKDGDLIENPHPQPLSQGEKWALVCPDHLTVPDRIKEKNWFFNLKKYQSRLEEFYTAHTDFARPNFRFNEIKAFVEQWLEDFSISREGSDFGVQLPFDADSVTYIWFDALYNYLTLCQWEDATFWTEGEVVHVIGKDISRFHAIFWPAMLKSSDNLPNVDTWKELVHGYFTVDGQKMSKTIWNVINPVELIEEYGRDALVYYFFSDIKMGNDGDFSNERFVATKENVLKKWWGNLVARVGKMAQKNGVSKVELTDAMLESLSRVAVAEGLKTNPLWMMCHNWFSKETLNTYASEFDLVSLLRDWFQLVQLWNKYVDETKPWVTAKEDPELARKDLQVLVRLVKQISLLSSSFLIEWFANVQSLYNIQHPLWAGYSTKNSSEDLKVLFNLKEFEVEFGSGYVY